MRRRVWLKLFIALLSVFTIVGVAAAEEDDTVLIEYDSFSLVGDELIVYGSETEPLVITMSDTVVYARQATMRQDDEERWNWALLEGDVRVGRDGTVITADQATLTFDDDRYIFEGSVYVHETKSTAREIWADRMEYDAETGNMVATGSVRMKEEGRSFVADTMEYDPEAERAVLAGNVVVTDSRGEISAQRLDIDLKEESFVGTGPGRIVLSELRRGTASNAEDDATDAE